MTALTRTRLPAALCVLLLLTVGSIARAGAPGRPIDRSGGPPESEPVEVGDPDAGHGSITIATYLRQWWGGMQLQLPAFRHQTPSPCFGRVRGRGSLPVRRSGGSRR